MRRDFLCRCGGALHNERARRGRHVDDERALRRHVAHSRSAAPERPQRVRGHRVAVKRDARISEALARDVGEASGEVRRAEDKRVWSARHAKRILRRRRVHRDDALKDDLAVRHTVRAVRPQRSVAGYVCRVDGVGGGEAAARDAHAASAAPQREAHEILVEICAQLVPPRRCRCPRPGRSAYRARSVSSGA